jgi:hypothetical protein
MTEQQPNAGRPEQVNVLLRSAKTMADLLAAHNEETRRADHFERVYNRTEAENGQLRETLERLTQERDGYFQHAYPVNAHKH